MSSATTLSAVGSLQGLGAADQDSLVGALAGSDDDGGGGGQSEGAGTGDDEHGNGHEDGDGEGGRRAEDDPEEEGGQGYGDDGRDEPCGDGIGQALDGSLGGLGFLDEADDAGEDRVLSHLSRPVGEGAGAVDGCPVDGSARGLVNGDALAGEHGLVNGGRAVHHLAVHGEFFAGTDHYEVFQLHSVDGDFDLVSIPDGPAPSRAAFRRGGGWPRWSGQRRGPQGTGPGG